MNLQGTLKRKTKQKGLTREELNNLSKEELIDRILQLEAHTVQLKNIINRNQIKKASASSASKKAFDFSKCGKRHVLLKLYYLGWDYNGFAVQEDTTETIEHYLFAALTKSCLIESRQTSNYHRCGRTDKGVSSFGQVISLDIRSRFSQVELDLNPNITEGELQYPKTLNRLLPDNIRILAWCPVPADYSARFSCKERTYKYFFPRGDLDIKVMNSAAQLLVGKHDFRNLCKMDVGNGVTAFDRVINSVEICVPGEDHDNPSGYDMCTLTLKGESFLWHQVRCIMGILFLIGQRKEKPDVITKLLNISEYPSWKSGEVGLVQQTASQFSLILTDLPINTACVLSLTGNPPLPSNTQAKVYYGWNEGVPAIQNWKYVESLHEGAVSLGFNLVDMYRNSTATSRFAQVVIQLECFGQFSVEQHPAADTAATSPVADTAATSPVADTAATSPVADTAVPPPVAGTAGHSYSSRQVERVDFLSSLIDVVHKTKLSGDKIKSVPDGTLLYVPLLALHSWYVTTFKKPQYNMGSEVPLNLFHCSFELADWIVDMEDLRAVVIHLQKIWSFLEIKSTMVRSMLNECESTLRENVPREQSSCLIQGCKPKTYVPLLERPLCESLEERVEHYIKRRRLKVENNADVDSASENDKQH